MANVKPRPITEYYGERIDLGLPTDVVIERLETYRTKRKWYELWKPKYNLKYYALTKKGVYDITPVLQKWEAEHE